MYIFCFFIVKQTGNYIINFNGLLSDLIFFLTLKPEACTQSIVKFDSTCNADFEDNMENKIIPFSILMIFLVPQV